MTADPAVAAPAAVDMDQIAERLAWTPKERLQ